MAGYQLPGTTLEEITQPGSSNLSSSFRLLNVIGKFNPYLVVKGEAVTKSNPLLGTQFFSHHFTGSDNITSIYAPTNSLIILGTATNGIQITEDGGQTWTNYNTLNSNIPSDIINAVFYNGGKLFVATSNGLGVSSDFGQTYTIYNTSSTPSLPSNTVNDVEVSGNYWYIATSGGLAVSNDNGVSFIITNQLGAAEVSTVTTIADNTVTLQNKSFNISSPTTTYTVWYNVAGGGTLTPLNPIEVAIEPNFTANQVAAATALAINSQQGLAFTATVNNSTVTITNDVAGTAADISDNDTGFSLSTITQGNNGVAEITDITCLPAAGLASRYFVIRSGGNAAIYWVWFNETGSDVAPVPNGGAILVEVDLVGATTANDVATAVAAALNGISGTPFSASASGAVVTCTNTSVGVTADAAPGNSGFTITVVTQGANPVAEVSQVVCTGLTVGLGSKYFTFSSDTTKYYAWYRVNNGNYDPNVLNRTGVVIDIDAGDSASTVASKTQVAINALPGITATVSANQVTITSDVVGHIAPDIADFNTGFTVAVTTQGKNPGLLNDNIKKVAIDKVNSSKILVGSSSGINVSLDKASTFTSTITTSQGLAVNDVKDIYSSGTNIFVATSSGLDYSIDSGVSFSPTSIVGNVRKIAVLNNYVYAAQSTGLQVSSNSGLTFTNRTTADGLNSLNINTCFINGQVLYVGTFSGLNISKNTDSVLHTVGTIFDKVGTLVGMDNYKSPKDYTADSNGVITWNNTSFNLPAPGSTFYVNYRYKRPITDYLKTYVYDDYQQFTADWQIPDSNYPGNIFVDIAMNTIGLQQISIVPVPETNSDADYINAILAIKERNIQDLVVLNSSESVQVQAAFSVLERSAPENAYYRMYWTGGPANYPLGDSNIPASLIGRKQLLENERTIFINAPRGKVTFINSTGQSETIQVDGSFLAGLIVAYYNSRPGANPNVEVMGKIMPGFTLYKEDFDNYYSKSKLIKAGQESLYLLQPVGSIGQPRVVDDLTTDSSTLERQNPNIIRTKDYINTDIANQMERNFQGKLMPDPGIHATAMLNYLGLLFSQYKQNKIVVKYKDLSVTRSSTKADTMVIKYAWEGVYTHKYTEGTYYIVVPTGV
jgi:hypothetical protein